MDEKGNKIEIDGYSKRLVWEVPKLICLDKGKTEGGDIASTFEDSSYSNPAS